MDIADITETNELISNVFENNENLTEDKILVEEESFLFETQENTLRSLQSDEVSTSIEVNDAISTLNVNNDRDSMDVDENVVVIRDSDSMDYEVYDLTFEETPELISTVVDVENQSSITNIEINGENSSVISKHGISETIINSIVDINTNTIQTAEIVPTAENKLSPNKTFTLPYRDVNCNNTEVYQPVFHIQICHECHEKITDKLTHLSWECLNFCNEDCLAKYQRQIGKQCAHCNTDVTLASLGKYCVRFGSDIRQFCQSKCLDAFKKVHKVCCYCQTFIIGQETMVTDQNNKHFCTQKCMDKYYQMNQHEDKSTRIIALCDVCKNEKLIRIEIEFDNAIVKLCSEPCFVAFKFANNVVTEQCAMCRKYYEQPTLEYTIYLHDQQILHFCCKTCQNIYIIANRKIVACDWCKVKKYNFDMIQKQCDGNNGQQTLIVCSFNCLAFCKLSLNSFPINFNNNHHQSAIKDAAISSTYAQSLSNAHIQSSNVIDPASNAHVQSSNAHAQLPNKPVQSSNAHAQSSNAHVQTEHHETKSQSTSPILDVSPKYFQQLIVKPPPVCEVKNKLTMCKPNVHTKGVSFKPLVSQKATQSDNDCSKSVLIPVPIAIYVPMPMVRVSTPFPIPVPFPLPVPVPVFIPTTRNSSQGILKEIKNIQTRLPNDPYEAELLVMAEMVAGDGRPQIDSEMDDDDNTSPLPIIGDDILQLALNMTENETAVEEEPHEVIDLEGALITNTITVSQESVQQTPTGAKSRSKRSSGKLKNEMSTMEIPVLTGTTQQEYENNDDSSTCDANMSLKYSFGVNAWKQWFQMKQNDIEKLPSTYPTLLSGRFMNKMKSDLLQLSADELNYSLSLFINEIRKPTNAEYAPDTIYYLCLGIQYYLYKHNRCDNIFTDIFYEKFTEGLNTIAKQFLVLYNDSHYIVTRVEEEHLWECKQLGAHSPQVLLNTLIFFNTKYFNLISIEDHMQLSFSHIMKHWKRNHANVKNGSGSNTSSVSSLSSRNVLLRYYPPSKTTSSSPTSSSKSVRKVYEQEENEENPLRCPVKLYEFYLSKCPESVKTRNDVFYLAPERSCLPDSPVWYSTLALDRHALEKMLYRVKMVKEINIAILRS